MARTLEQNLQEIVGQLVMQIAQLTTANQLLEQKLAEFIAKQVA